jgi:GT2 family glycosyltransferase/glycosyltransferase involved in cell wall biosynthesis
MLITSATKPGRDSARRVLVISTTFFPDPGVSAIRMTQWCRHLPKQGWEPHVLCRYYGFRATAEDLARNVHPDVKIHYLDWPGGHAFVRIPRSTLRLAGRVLSSWLLSGIFVPDVSICFWRRIRPQVLEHVRTIQPDVIITTSPPYSNHDIGMWLTRQTGIPWIADFRDPHLIDNRFKPTGLGRMRWRAHEHFQESIYCRAWLVIHAIPIDARWARRRFPFARNRIRILTNGFPHELLSELAMSDRPVSARKRILVAGTIPEPEQLRLARAVAKLAGQGQDVELRLVGKIPKQKKKLEQILGNRFVATGYVQHRQSLREVADANVLVNYLDHFRGESCLLSMKLFEYLASNKPTVVINPSRSERMLLRHAQGVGTLHRPSIPLIAAALEKAIHDRCRHGLEVEEFRRRHNWNELSRTVGSWLDELTAFPTRVAPRLEPPSNPQATIVISTRNRKEMLRRSILSALNQSVLVEVIVADDGSTDGTADMVRYEFPQVRFYEFGGRLGPSFLRNRGIELSSTDSVFPIDDDSIFSSPRVVEQTIKEFDDPRVVAVAIPFVNPRLEWTQRQVAPDVERLWVTDAFVGAAHAIRRSLFLKMGGYREHFFYMGEEADLCIRFLAAGYVVRLGMADPIFHMESIQRDVPLADFYGRRNDVLFTWHNVPMPWLPIHLVATTFNGLLTSLRTRHLLPMLKGIVAGYSEVLRARQPRQPVTLNLYRLHRKLKKRGPQPLAAIEPELPPLRRDHLIATTSVSEAKHASAN